MRAAGAKTQAAGRDGSGAGGKRRGGGAGGQAARAIAGGRRGDGMATRWEEEEEADGSTHSQEACGPHPW